MKKKNIIWAVVIILLIWYSFYATFIKINLKNTKQFQLICYKQNINIVKNLVFIYYTEHRIMPSGLNKSLANGYYPEDVFYCIYRKLMLRLSNPTFKNILLFPVAPFTFGKFSTKKFKYSYVYDKAKKSYIVTLSSPFEDEPMFKALVFEIPKDYKEKGKRKEYARRDENVNQQKKLTP